MLDEAKRLSPAWVLAMGTTIVCWGMSPLLGAIAGETLPALYTVAAGCAVGALTMLVLALAAGRLSAFARYSWRDHLAMAGFSLTSLAPYLVILYLAYAKANPATALILNHLWIVWMALLGRILLKEKVGLVGALGLGISLVGMLILARAKGSLAFRIEETGYYAAVAFGGILWAWFSVGGKLLGKRLEPVTSMMLYLAVASAALFLVAGCMGTLRWPTSREAVVLVLLGVFPLGIAYRLWFRALETGPVAPAGNAVLLAPFVALLLLRIFRGSVLSRVHWLALALVVGGLVTSRLRRPT